LASIPPFEVNFDLLKSASVNTYPYPVEISLDVDLNASGYTRTSKYSFRCTDWKKDCKGMSYATTENPLFAIPPIIANLPGVGDLFTTVQGNYSIPVAPPSSRNISFVVVLSYETNTFVQNIPLSGIHDLSVEFHGKLGNAAGEPIVGNFSSGALSEQKCDHAKFQKSVSTISQILGQLSDLSSVNDINTLRYILDSTAYQDDFTNCKSFVDSLTVGVSSQNFNITKLYCPWNSSSIEWFWDPCCNQAAQWTGTCFPQNISGPISQFEVQDEKVNQVCKNVGCSQSYLEDYASAKEAFEAGQCSVDNNANNMLKQKAQKQFLMCKQQAFPFADKTCLADSDCLYWYNNVTYPCSMRTRKCLVPYRVMERSFVDCLDDYLTEAQEEYIMEVYGFSSQNTDADDLFLQHWMDGVTVTECVAPVGSSPSLEHRRKILNVPLDYDCAIAFSCDSYECEDQSCQYPDMTCQYTCGMTPSYEASFESKCLADYVCNWDADLCDGEDLATCTDLCENQPGQDHFCGFCDSANDCMEFTELATPEACASTSVCLLTNGSYFFNLTDSQCNALQRCDLPYCGRECASRDSTYSSGICFSYEANQTDCTNKGGQWLNNTGSFSTNADVCVFSAANSAACSNYVGAIWESCGDLTLSECAVCSGSSCPNMTQNLMRCHIAGKPCTDQATCTNSGICSDSEFFLDMNSAPQMYGGCQVIRSPPSDVTSFPYCLYFTTSIPSACIWPLSIAPTSEECYDMAEALDIPRQYWTVPAEDEATCLAPKGCRQLFQGQLRFSLKDEENCVSEYDIDEWVSIWEWQGGRWIGGVQRNLSWTAREALPKFQWNSSVNYMYLQADFLDGALHVAALDSKSAALCQYERTIVPMQAVTCDCTDSGSSECFSGETVHSIAQSQMCADTPSTEFYPGMRLTVYNDTMDLGCADIVISAISVHAFASQHKEHLLANFIPFSHTSIPQFPVYNQKDAIVGKLLASDDISGITLTPLAAKEVGHFELCIQLESAQKRENIDKDSQDYPTMDFGAPNEKGDKIVPLHLDVYEVKIVQNSVFDGKYLCAVISNLTQESSFFAIQRKSSYEDVEQATMSPTALALCYTLAAMFLLAALISTGEIVFYVYYYFFKNLPLILEHFLVAFVWLFVAVRAIYFLNIANGFESQVGDYVLVALPTFFYFTAFSIIVVLWAVVASKRFTNDVQSFKNVINKLLIGVNIVLYAIFVALVLAFQFAKSVEESPCSGRQESTDNSAELKRRISIAYGMIIAIISLIIGVLFVVFGIRIRTFISVSQSHEKIFIVTAICSGCFILHSIFIVVVSFLTTPNLYFSFFGLIITEWFPAIFITSWLFIQRTSTQVSTEKKTTTDGKRNSTPMRGSYKSRSGMESTQTQTEDGQVEMADLAHPDH